MRYLSKLGLMHGAPSESFSFILHTVATAAFGASLIGNSMSNDTQKGTRQLETVGDTMENSGNSDRCTEATSLSFGPDAS